jgi:hypothetical protein
VVEAEKDAQVQIDELVKNDKQQNESWVSM